MREARKRGSGFAVFADQNGKIRDPTSRYDQGHPVSGREAGYNHALKCCRCRGALSRLCSCITIGGLMRNISRRGVCAALSLGALSLAGCQNTANQNEPAGDAPTISDSAGTDHAADEPVEEPEDTSSSEPQGTVERLLATMTLEQKVAQLFPRYARAAYRRIQSHRRRQCDWERALQEILLLAASCTSAKHRRDDPDARPHLRHARALLRSGCRNRPVPRRRRGRWTACRARRQLRRLRC